MATFASTHSSCIRPAIIAGAAIVFAVSLAAQSSGLQPVADSSDAVAQACPIAMHARQGVGGAVLNARAKPGDQGQGSAGPGQHIHLVLGKGREVAEVVGVVIGVKVTVHGTSGRNRSLAADFGTVPVSDLARSFDLPVKISGDKSVATDLALGGFTSVQSITLEAVAYGDGSRWTASEGQSCRVAPDALMLVGGR
jgi:hypothetical protein